MRTCQAGFVGLLIGTMMLHAGVAEEEPRAVFPYPVLTVPKLNLPPELDGRIDADEWAHAAAFTGLSTGVADGSAGIAGSACSMVPEMQQVVWYVGYDDERLYLAMRSPHPKGTWPIARGKEDDVDRPLLFEDHVEIQITPYSRIDAVRPGKGFFKIMVNAKETLCDQHFYNGTPGTENDWTSGAEPRCHVTDEAWEMELAIELRRLNVETLDGRNLVVQLVRTDSCSGIYFAGLVGASWTAWDKFARMDFDPSAPAFQLLKIGEVGDGVLDAEIRVAGTAEAPADVLVEISIEDPAGKILYDEKQSVTVGNGDIEALRFAATDLPVVDVPNNDGKTRNKFHIRATTELEGREIVLFENRTPFIKLNRTFREGVLAQWLKGRPVGGDWEHRFAYMPYYDKAEVSVDLDFFGMPEKITGADRFSVAITRDGDETVLAHQEGVVTNLTGGPAMIDMPPMEDGDYRTTFALLDAAGQTISTREDVFQRTRRPWEHNQLGISDEVIPPFVPVVVGDLKSIRMGGDRPTLSVPTMTPAVSVWGRNYRLSEGGLLTQVLVARPTGNAGRPVELLARPMRYELRSGGTTFTNAVAGVQPMSESMARAAADSATTAGPLTIRSKTFVEYDGWVETEVALDEGDIEIEYLDIVADFCDRRTVGSDGDMPVDTLYVQRDGDRRQGNHFGGIPDSPGVHFSSTQLPSYRLDKHFDWKSFVPRTFVGNGDCGLWFWAWSAAGWELSDEQPMLRIERLQDGTVRMRVRLLAGPCRIAETRNLRFAFQASPVKPNHDRFRTTLDEGYVAHDGSGYRNYGDSVDGYLSEAPGAYEALRKWMLYGPRYIDEKAKPFIGGRSRTGHRYVYENTSKRARICMYGSGQLTGVGAEDFRLFGGEWFLDNNWRASGDQAGSFKGFWNYQGTAQWNRPEQLSVRKVNWSQSYVDFYIWNHKPLLEKAGFNGTWWDNASIGTVWEYNPALGRMESTWLDYRRRELAKRLNTLGWQLMRPPCWMMNFHPDLAWNQVFWIIENDWYAPGPEIDIFDHLGLDAFRAMARTRSVQLVAAHCLIGYDGVTPESNRRIKRALLGMLLLHDLYPDGGGVYHSFRNLRDITRLLSDMKATLDLGDSRNCLFTGYWRSADMVTPPHAAIKASVYRNYRNDWFTENKVAFVVLVNTGPADLDLAGTTLNMHTLLPSAKRVKRVYDPETGEGVPCVMDDDLFTISEPCEIGWHEPKFIAIEGE